MTAEILLKNVSRLHGIPRSIITERDPLDYPVLAVPLRKALHHKHSVSYAIRASLAPTPTPPLRCGLPP